MEQWGGFWDSLHFHVCDEMECISLCLECAVRVVVVVYVCVCVCVTVCNPTRGRQVHVLVVE